MSPILLRPVREQLEHDRVIRLLQTRWRRRYQVAVNIGPEQTTPVGPAGSGLYPDLVLASLERASRIDGTVEVETTESVNSMEAMAQWARFARLRIPFYLYVPNGSVDAARRLCTNNNIPVAEIWSYYTIGDQVRFTQVFRAPAPQRPSAQRSEAASREPSAGASRNKAAGGAGRKTAAAPRRKAAAAPARRKSAETPRRKTADSPRRASAAKAGKSGSRAGVKKASGKNTRTQKRK